MFAPFPVWRWFSRRADRELAASIVAVMRVFKIDVPNIPTIDRIVVQCSTLDAFARAEPSRQVGAPG